jgi:hypothetical protein
VKYLGFSDSRAIKLIVDEKHYGDTKTVKLVCVGYIQKQWELD